MYLVSWTVSSSAPVCCWSATGAPFWVGVWTWLTQRVVFLFFFVRLRQPDISTGLVLDKHNPAKPFSYCESGSKLKLGSCMSNKCASFSSTCTPSQFGALLKLHVFPISPPACHRLSVAVCEFSSMFFTPFMTKKCAESWWIVLGYIELNLYQKNPIHLQQNQFMSTSSQQIRTTSG